jgi:hypothetical protein
MRKDKTLAVKPSIFDQAAAFGYCATAKPNGSLSTNSLSSSDKRPRLLMCIKEGCTTTLKSAHPDTKRCHAHANQCIKKNCGKQKRGKDVYCAAHRRLEILKDSCLENVCQKEGCTNALAPNQTKRCLAHKNQCKREGCAKWSRSCDEFCFKHGRQSNSNLRVPPKTKKTNQIRLLTTNKYDSNINRVCIKEGCDNVLKQHQSTRCSEHIMRCIKKGCNEYFADGQRGCCFEHAPKKK